MNNQIQKSESLSWEAPEYIHHPKTAIWYIFFTLVAVGLIIYSFYLKSVLTMITFGLIIILGFIFSHKKPAIVSHKLTSNGIVLGDIIYPYKNIVKFWILYNPPHVKTLNLETTAYVNQHVALQLGDQDPVEVKIYLAKHLPEDLEKEESLTDAIARRLKF
jgi:hypothetical protein